jgi:MFS family permease
MTAHLSGLFLLGRILPGVAVGVALVLSFTAIRSVSHHNQFGKALGVWNLLILATFLTGSLLGVLMADNSSRLDRGMAPLMALSCRS